MFSFWVYFFSPKGSLHYPQAGFLQSNVRQNLKLLARAREVREKGKQGFGEHAEQCWHTMQGNPRFALNFSFSVDCFLLWKQCCILKSNIKSRRLLHGVNIFHKPCEIPNSKSFQCGTEARARDFCRKIHKPAISARVQSWKDSRKAT